MMKLVLKSNSVNKARVFGFLSYYSSIQGCNFRSSNNVSFVRSISNIRWRWASSVSWCSYCFSNDH